MSSVSCDQSHTCVPTLVGWLCLKRSPNLLSDPFVVCTYLMPCVWGGGGGDYCDFISHISLRVQGKWSQKEANTLLW